MNRQKRLINLIKMKYCKSNKMCCGSSQRHPCEQIICYSHFTQYSYTKEYGTANRCVEHGCAIVLLRQVYYSPSSYVCFGFFVLESKSTSLAAPARAQKMTKAFVSSARVGATRRGGAAGTRLMQRPSVDRAHPQGYVCSRPVITSTTRTTIILRIFIPVNKIYYDSLKKMWKVNVWTCQWIFKLP